jgi:hypothetical protein
MFRAGAVAHIAADALKEVISSRVFDPLSRNLWTAPADLSNISINREFGSISAHISGSPRESGRGASGGRTSTAF